MLFDLPVTGSIQALRAAWVAANQAEDELEFLLTVDAYADYLAGFINPEGVRMVLNAQEQLSNKTLNFSVKNDDAKQRTRDASAGIVPKLRVNDAIKNKMAEYRSRQSKMSGVGKIKLEPNDAR